VRLITGDHPVTATVVANELGLQVTAAQVITGTEWEALSAVQRAKAVTTRLVFARMSPEHKIEVVQTLESAGLVSAMVGDGANAAAAIRAASVGIGVAARGSDPTRIAADCCSTSASRRCWTPSTKANSCGAACNRPSRCCSAATPARCASP
jgi:magnesium-transporting ATPase (P-type)